jgi:hypothetical protein
LLRRCLASGNAEKKVQPSTSGQGEMKNHMQHLPSGRSANPPANQQMPNKQSGGASKSKNQ